MKWIPTTTGSIIEILSPQDLQKVHCDTIAVNLLPLWARPGTEELAHIHSVNQWANTNQKILPINGLQWLYQNNVSVKVKPEYLSYRSPLNGMEQKISPKEFIQLQTKWQFEYAVTLTCPLYAFKNMDAVNILQTWIEQSLEIAKQHQQKLIIELPCFPATQIDKLVKTFAQEELIHGIFFYLENNAEMFSIDQQIYNAILGQIPQHWHIGLNTNHDYSILEKMQLKRVEWLMTETPYNDAKEGFFYHQNKRLAVTDPVYAADTNQLVEACSCDTCSQFTRAYLHHLMDAREVFAWRLMGIHNWYSVAGEVSEI